jgi:hypothetical protein
MYAKIYLINSECSTDVRPRTRRFERESNLKNCRCVFILKQHTNKGVFNLQRLQNDTTKQHNFITKLGEVYVLEILATIHLEPCSFARAIWTSEA